MFFFLLRFFSNAQEHKDPKIVGGVEAEVGRYPYQVVLLDWAGRTGCGGTLIAPDIVLSAAHCGGGRYTNALIGVHDLSDIPDTHENIGIRCKIIHPSYNEINFQNDLMILKLETSSSYFPVALDDNTQNLSEEGNNVTVMGWGTTISGGFPSSVLLEVELDIISNQECDEQYGGLITNDMICASRPGKDSCQGDSGGPLIVKGTSVEEDVIIGVVSWGMGCANPDYAGVYARVGENISWIKNEIRRNRKATTRANLIIKLKNMLM